MIYLASTSPRRKLLLKRADIAFKAVSPKYHERFRTGENVRAAVRRHALEKAREVAARHRDATVIGADTVVYFRGKIIGKPRDHREAVRTLLKLAGRTHTVYTGVAIIRKRGGQVTESSFVEATRVTLKPMDLEAIRRYFRKITPLDKAGAYAIQSRQTGIVARVKGSFTNAVGLPMERLCVILRRGLYG